MELPEAADMGFVKMDDQEPEQVPDQLGSLGQDTDDNNASEEEDHAIDHNDTIFFMAIRGLFDGIRAAISLEKMKSPADGDMQFACDPEPPPALIDRHQPKLAGVKVKTQPYQSSMAGMGQQYGNSRAVSRASSRIASRFGGGSVAASSTAFRSSVMAAVNASKMSFPGSQSPGKTVFDAASWQSNAFLRDEAGESGGLQISESAASSARYSLGMSSRTAVDYAEVFRRQEVSQEIDRRDSKIKRTQEIQRKSELRLKLRSLADPSISVEREETLALEAIQNEGRGRSRMASRAMTPALPLKKLSSIAKTSVQSSSPMAGPSESTITFRTEDYEGLDSHVVMLETNGELLVGENCFVVAKKPRAEMQQDLVHKSLVAPRFQLAGSPLALAEEEFSDDQTKTTAPGQEEQEHLRSPSRQSKGQRKTGIFQNPMFEGQSGSFQSFPKLELDPSKTKLAKGVVLHGSPIPIKDVTTKKAVPSSTKKPALLAQIQEDTTNQHLDVSMSSLVQDAKSKHSNQSRQPFNQANALSQRHKETMGSFLPKHLGENEKHPQSLRIRTPAIQNRSSRKAPPSWGQAEFEDEHDNESGLFSLQSVGSQQRSLPTVSYMREFPSPPLGQIRMNPAASRSLLGANSSSFPFPSSLPMVIKQSKR